MVAGHHLQRPRSEDPLAIELAAAPKHLGEAQVVRHRARQAPAAGEERRTLEVLARLGIVHQAERLVAGATIASRQPLRLLGRDEEPRVLHAQRAEDGLLEILVEGLPGDRLDEVPAHVRRVGVHPTVARIEAQRHVRELFDEAA